MDEPTTRQPGSADAPAAPGQGAEPAAVIPDGGPAKPVAGKRNLWLIGGGALLVILLAAAAFVGGRWLNRGPAGVSGGPGAGQTMKMFRSGGSGPRSFTIEPAKELPQSKPDLMGVLVRRQDNSLFLGTGKVTQIAQIKNSQAQVSPPTYDGPVLEAVVTHDTQILRDETNLAAPTIDQSNKVQQIVKPGSLDEITTNSIVQVWGEKTGNRTVARVLMYKPG